ncbi:MAG: hypothetical protein WA979_08975 [Pacificimonas sp.]
MTAPVVSPFLMNAQAFPAHPSEPHLTRGTHLRISHNPLLGLPAAPFMVAKIGFKEMKRFQLRQDALWVDSRGQVITPPFSLRPDNPVTCHLIVPQGEACVWARIVADPGGGGQPPVLTHLGGRVSSNATTSRTAAANIRTSGNILRDRVLGTAAGRADIRLPDNVRDRIRQPVDIGDIIRRPMVPKGIRVEAFADGMRGLNSVGVRTEPRYAFSAPGLMAFELSGTGAVAGIEWLEKGSLDQQKFRQWRALNLPHKSGHRYISVKDPEDAAMRRVQDAAPKRRPLQDVAGVGGPASAPPHDAAEEARRVTSLTEGMDDILERLINDDSASQLNLEERNPIPGVTNGFMRIKLLHHVMQGTLDPGTAEWLGYMTVDRDELEEANAFTFYHVEGFFSEESLISSLRLNPGDPDSAKKALLRASLNNLPADAVYADARAAIPDIRRRIAATGGADMDEDELARFAERSGRMFRIGSVAVADIFAPAAPPAPPRITDISHVGWLPAPIDTPRRQVDVSVDGGELMGLMAAERRANGSDVPLNRKNARGFHTPLTLSLPSDTWPTDVSPRPGTGFIHDDRAPAAGARYSLAQQDRFGRWTGYARRDIGPGIRPAPPIPVLQALYKMPELTDPEPSPFPRGVVRIRVPVPGAETLAPAAHRLGALVMETTGHPGVTSPRTEVIADPANPGDMLDFTFDAPRLNPQQVLKLTFTAIWRDTTGRTSAQSQPVVLTLRDPRPPAQLTVPDILSYSARPDAQGRALVEYDWAPLPGQEKISVHYSDENRLTAFLEENSADSTTMSDALAEVRAAVDIAGRATVLRAHAQLFKASLFERLELVPTALPGGRLRFQHYLSGSLKTISFYRLSAETGTGSRVPLERLPMLSFGVPNSAPPAKPMLDIRPALNDAGEHVANIVVRAVPGVTRPETVRLRRSLKGADTPLTMPIIVAEATPPTLMDDFLVSEAIDDGPLQIAAAARMKPWTRYTWVAEVQGAPEPGSTVSGMWSPPSDPVTLAFVPAGPPAPPAAPEVTGTLLASAGGEPERYEDLVLEVTHPDTLNGGAFGDYILRINRQLPGEGQVHFADEILSGAGPFRVQAATSTEAIPQGTTWRLTLIDPLGRSSAPVTVSTVVAG